MKPGDLNCTSPPSTVPASPAYSNPAHTPSPDQSWGCHLGHASRLRLNALDFSDLWDEEELELGSTEEEEGPPASDGTDEAREGGVGPQCPLPPPPPPPPPAPPCPGGPPLLPKGRTLRLHWKELLSLPALPCVSRFGPQTIWASLQPVSVDADQLRQLFGSRGSLLGGWKPAPCRKQCVSVLDIKRSNIINIALSRLPPPRLITHAILSMDNCVLDREDIQRLQSLVPTEEELTLIREAQRATSSSPLAPAELCLLTLGSVPHLSPRLDLWAFTLDYDTLEREIAEPLFHLKLAMEQLASNQTFRHILATVLAIGNFLNGGKARGFELGYLGKLAQVRDTASRQPLLHHTCTFLLDTYPQCTDLYSEITAVAKAAKLQNRCKASWEQLHWMKRDGRGEEAVRTQLPEFLRDCEERLAVLRAVYRRVTNRFHSFLLFLGYSSTAVRSICPEAFCKTVSDFSLEYRSARLAILQQRERLPASTHSRSQSLGAPGPTQALQHHREMEEVLRTPEPSPRLDLSLPRSRSKRTEPTGSLPRKLKW
ncbi:FH1/FH2 domain-containing protein 1 isoform X2 [Lepisosteus oculatus]|uniref:FH1/FH2 domain-containing protein 1 isoform X2 n=1 Tax=Lepisosteus oculatus TaxID=7918 RepID=UPI00371967A1